MTTAEIIMALAPLLQPSGPSIPPPSSSGLCGLFPQPVTVIAPGLPSPVTFRFTLAGLPSPSNVFVAVQGPRGFGSAAGSANCTAGTCTYTPQFAWVAGNYTWTTQALDLDAGCAGAPSLPQGLTLQ